jgi:hypothetical protein
MATTAAAIAAATGAVAYLNGKYHLGQDIKMLKFRRDAAKHYEDLGMLPSSIEQPCMASQHVTRDITRSCANKQQYEESSNLPGTLSRHKPQNFRMSCVSGRVPKLTLGKRHMIGPFNGLISFCLRA